jgi:ankyrin repeat protein
MKHILITTIAAVLLAGCGPSASERALLNAAEKGNIEAVKQHLADGADVNVKYNGAYTPLDVAIKLNHTETIALLRKHGGKTKRELEAEGK